MQTWLAIVLTIIGIIGGIATGCGYIYKHIWKPLSAMYKTIYQNKEFVDKVMYNLSPNGGNSLVDKVNRIENTLKEIHLHTKLIKHKQQTKLYLDNQPMFECDENGYNVFVNRRWCEITGLDEEEALGYGWINALYPSDRQRVHDEWQRTIKADSQISSEYRFYNKNTNQIIPVRSIAKIERDKKGEILFIIGTFEIVEDKIKTNALKTA